MSLEGTARTQLEAENQQDINMRNGSAVDFECVHCLSLSLSRYTSRSTGSADEETFLCILI